MLLYVWYASFLWLPSWFLFAVGFQWFEPNVYMCMFYPACCFLSFFSLCFGACHWPERISSHYSFDRSSAYVLCLPFLYSEVQVCWSIRNFSIILGYSALSLFFFSFSLPFCFYLHNLCCWWTEFNWFYSQLYLDY